MKFVDEVVITVCGGKGGDGSVHFRREKFEPLGGPDGGDGGNGGAVILYTDPGLNTLIDFAHAPLLRAGHGGTGGGSRSTGKDGKECFRRTPVGTQVYFGEELVADLKEQGARWVAARGGRGGKGNHFFKSPSNRAPKTAQRGQEGEKHELRLVLKSVADVGLAGFPSVGKSTLVSTITEAQLKIAEYPFTTLRPSLGVVMYPDERRLVVADIPGLITGAHEGKGLGIRFLKHIERAKALAQMIDLSILGREYESDEDIMRDGMEQYEGIDSELRSFSDEVGALPRLVVFSKAEFDVNRKAYELCREEIEKRGYQVLLISSHTGEGLGELKDSLYSLVQSKGS